MCWPGSVSVRAFDRETLGKKGGRAGGGDWHSKLGFTRPAGLTPAVELVPPEPWKVRLTLFLFSSPRREGNWGGWGEVRQARGGRGWSGVPTPPTPTRLPWLVFALVSRMRNFKILRACVPHRPTGLAGGAFSGRGARWASSPPRRSCNILGNEERNTKRLFLLFSCARCGSPLSGAGPGRGR